MIIGVTGGIFGKKGPVMLPFSILWIILIEDKWDSPFSRFETKSYGEWGEIFHDREGKDIFQELGTLLKKEVCGG